MEEGSAITTIELSGVRRVDHARALKKFRQMADDPLWVVPKGCVMHHAPMCGEIQVVPFELHGENPHTGGFTVCPATRTEHDAVPDQRMGPGPLGDGGPPLKEKNIRKLEREFGCELPTAYRKFLLQSNGGRPARQTLLRAGGDAGDVVERFFGLGDAGADLFGVFDIFSSRIPRGLLPIASDPFGNLILLGLAGPDTGRVFFWDHEIEPEGNDAPDANVAPVADAFPQFLGNFRGLPRDERLP